MLSFVDREAELETMERLFCSESGSLLILYGRRRVGKTALIQHFLADKAGLYFLATEESEIENLHYFRRLVATFLSNDLIREAGGLGWERLAVLFSGKTGKKLLIIDEFQYLCKANPAFSSIMQRLYDTVLKPAGIMVILCGSYIRMMESETLNYDSPLYGRRDGQIRLGPIPFRDYSAFFPHRKEDEILQFYAVTGGIPRYVEMLVDAPDVRAGIDTAILDPQSMLFEEPLFLLSHEVREVGSYFTVLKTIASGNRRPSAIAAVMQIPQTSLSKLLSMLISLDILERRVPVTENNPEKSKKAIYRIKDHFLAFWFKFVFPYRSSLSLRDYSESHANLDAAFISGHVSYVFEDVCAEKMWDMSIAKEFGCSLLKVGNWWNAKTGIDLVGLGSDGKTLVVAECKYLNHPIGSSVLAELRNKSREIMWNLENREVHFVLFSRNGFDRNLTDMAKLDPTIHLVGLR